MDAVETVGLDQGATGGDERMCSCCHCIMRHGADTRGHTHLARKSTKFRGDICSTFEESPLA